MKKLHLYNMGVSDAGLGKIAEMCPNLEYVNINSCLKITNAGAASLAQHCPRIHTLHLKGTRVGWLARFTAIFE
jgi:hypothetical protein